MDIYGVVLWAFRSIGDSVQVLIPVILLLIAWFWCKSEHATTGRIALLGAVVASFGRASRYFLDSISWRLQSNIEHIPTGQTTLGEAIVYLTFYNLGLGIFLIAVLIHFVGLAKRKGQGEKGPGSN